MTGCDERERAAEDAEREVFDAAVARRTTLAEAQRLASRAYLAALIAYDRAAGLPADNELDEQAYMRAKDESNDA